MPDDWRRHLDDEPVQRGCRLNIKRIVIDSKPISLEFVNGVHLAGVFNGYIELRTMTAVETPADVERARAGIARGTVPVEPVIPTEDALHAVEEADAKARRIKNRQAADFDVKEFLLGKIGGYFCLAEIYAGVYGVTLETAAEETFTGHEPLFAPNFKGMVTLAERRAAFAQLSPEAQLDLRQRFGKVIANGDAKGYSSPQRNKCNARREDLSLLLQMCKEVIMPHGVGGAARLVEYKYSDRNTEAVPQGARDHWTSLKLVDPWSNSIYHVRP